MTTQHDRLAEIVAQFSTIKEAHPPFADAYESMAQEAYGGGSIPAKYKRLMALTAALVHGCEGCILFQTDHALRAGATREEVEEAVLVAVSLGGSMASSQAARVAVFLDEAGAP